MTWCSPNCGRLSSRTVQTGHPLNFVAATPRDVAAPRFRNVARMLWRAILFRTAFLLARGRLLNRVVFLVLVLVVLVFENSDRSCFEGDCRDAVAEQLAIFAEPDALDRILGFRHDGHQLPARFQDDNT